MRDINLQLNRWHDARWLSVPLLIGLASFMLVFGPEILAPDNIGWLQTGDRAQHFLGWQFYRHGPWEWPIGLNPNFGLELSSAIIFSDSNPIFAILFKVVAPLLSEPFQYFGFWLLLCFVLQAVFAWQISGALGFTRLQQTMVTVVAVFSPPFLFRLLYHMSLGGHFIILAALFLSFRKTNREQTWPWVLLLCIAVGLHAYLFVMAAAIWLAQLIDLIRLKNVRWHRALAECVLVLASVALTMWQVGYFSTQSVSVGGYGTFRMNALSYLNPSVHGWDWSYLIRALPFDDARDGFEGFNYAGLGTLFLLPAAIFGAIRVRHQLSNFMRAHGALILILFLMAVFALTNEIGIGRFWFHISLPEKWLQLANTFRASGRMFWPAFYALFFAVTFCVAKGYRPQISALILAVAMVLQVADTRAGWQYLRDERVREPASDWQTPLTDPAWNALMSHYSEIRMMSPGDIYDWKSMAFLAGRHHRATDSVMLARLDEAKLANTRLARRAEILEGRYAPGAFYVLDEASLFELAPHIQPPDSLAMVDGYFILAPGWLDCRDCPPIAENAVIKKLLENIRQNPGYLPKVHEFDFGLKGNGTPYLGKGWSWAEPWGLWSNGSSATVSIPAEGGDVFLLTLKAHPHVNKMLLQQHFIVSLNDEVAGTYELSETLPFILRIPVTEIMRARIRREGQILVKIEMPDAAAPSAMGTGQDDRLLGIGLYSIKTYE